MPGSLFSSVLGVGRWSGCSVPFTERGRCAATSRPERIFFNFLPVRNFNLQFPFAAAAQRQIGTQGAAVLQLVAEVDFSFEGTLSKFAERGLTANVMSV